MVLTASDFERLREIDRSYSDCASSLRIASLGMPAQQFAANMDRALSTPMLLNALYNGSAVLLGQSGFRPRSASEQVLRRLARGDQIQYDEVNEYLLERALVTGREQISIGLSSILPSIVVDSWIAFEVLSFGLWCCAYDSLPVQFRLLDGNPDRIKPGKRATSGRKNSRTTAQRKPVPSSQSLAATDVIELKHIPGFASISSIRQSYARLFSEVHGIRATAKIDCTLADRGLEFAALARQVVVHSAGIVDSVFVTKAKRIWRAPKLAVGKPIPLNGANTKGLVNHVVALALNLLIGVDRWVQTARNR
jgi:hypothetical protein